MLPWPRGKEGTFYSSSQAVNTNFLVLVLTRLEIEAASSVSAADALFLGYSISFNKGPDTEDEKSLGPEIVFTAI